VRRQPLDIVDRVIQRGYMQTTAGNREFGPATNDPRSNAQGAEIQDMSV
jgi:ribosome modulation factor